MSLQILSFLCHLSGAILLKIIAFGAWREWRAECQQGGKTVDDCR